MLDWRYDKGGVGGYRNFPYRLYSGHSGDWLCTPGRHKFVLVGAKVLTNPSAAYIAERNDAYRGSCLCQENCRGGTGVSCEDCL